MRDLYVQRHQGLLGARELEQNTSLHKLAEENSS